MTQVTARARAAPEWMRWTLDGGGRVAPGLTAALVHRLLFTPVGARVRPAERALLQRAERFTVEVPALPAPPPALPGPVAGYAWGEGPRVLLVHGWGGHAGQLAALVEPLVRAGRRVVAVDLPGHGGSGRGMASLVHFRRALAAVAAHVGPFEAVVAHSLGCCATLLARDEGLQAGRLVFVAPPARFATVWDEARRRLGVSERVLARALERAQAWLGVRFDDLEPLPRVGRLQADLVVVHARDDREMPFADGEELARACPRGRLLGLEGGGHVRLLRDPEVARRLADLAVGGLS